MMQAFLNKYNKFDFDSGVILTSDRESSGSLAVSSHKGHFS